jgi:hypothetical protein
MTGPTFGHCKKPYLRIGRIAALVPVNFGKLIALFINKHINVPPVAPLAPSA